MTAFHLRTVVYLVAAALAGAALPAVARSYDDDGYRSGMIFMITNEASGNELLAYARGPEGALNLEVRTPTGGQGSGDDLTSQGAVTLSGDGRFLFVVNGLSNTVSTFAVEPHALRLVSVVSSGGLRPISVVEYQGLVYVLNTAGSGNVSGFRNVLGDLRPIADSARGFSVAGDVGSFQVGFSTDGQALVVAETFTDALTSYRVGSDGKLGAPLVTRSAGQTPFGFAFDQHNHLIVSEAVGVLDGASSTSSYRFDRADPARPVVVSSALPNGQTASCWVAITRDGHFAYVTNPFSGSISSYSIEQSGAIKLADPQAGRANATLGDASVSRDGHQLYVINLRQGGFYSFNIGFDGSLTEGPVVTGLPLTTQGLAAN